MTITKKAREIGERVKKHFINEDIRIANKYIKGTFSYLSSGKCKRKPQ